MRAPKVHIGPRGGAYTMQNGIKKYVNTTVTGATGGGTQSRKAKQNGGEIATLTEVQALSLEPGLAGRDILAKSNTGSGKTLAFLMVAVERIRAHGGPDPNASFPVVILTPVTDLATQIMQVAKRFLAYHGMTADVAIGGTNEKQDIQRLSSRRIDVLVATPGRFKSILDQSPTVAKRLALCQTFVIDEADKMTDPGFIGQTKYIHARAMNSKMQTLMFSATIEKDVLIATGLLKSDAVFIDASAGSKPQVNTKVKQVAIVAPIAQHMDALVQVVRGMVDPSASAQKGGASAAYDVASYRLTEETRKALKEWEMPSMKGYRIMVFLSSNAYIDYVADVFHAIMPSVTQFVLHGNLQQNKRTKMSDAFRTTDNCVLFTSDASARGVDYPDVTCVIQMGFDSRSEYLQRVGRTGRAGKKGTTYLITCPEENGGVESICEFISELYVGECAVPRCGARLAAKRYRYANVTYAQGGRNAKGAKQALGGWLGSLASKWKRMKMSPQAVVDMATSQAIAFGLEPMPMDKLCGKLHLKGAPCS
jgi:ATP-dependent RNA helicase MSS116